MKTNEKSFFNIHNIVYCGLGGFCERFLKMLIHMLCFTFKGVLLFACFSFDLNFFIYLYTVTLFTSTRKVFLFNSTVTCLLSSTYSTLFTCTVTLLTSTVTSFTCTFTGTFFNQFRYFINMHCDFIYLHSFVKKATVKKISILFIYIFL